jgi:hypothetical protein
MTLAVAHNKGDQGFLDAVREAKRSFSPEQVVTEFAITLKSFRVSTVAGDRYAGDGRLSTLERKLYGSNCG